MNKNLLFSVLALTASVFADGDTTNSSAMLDDGLVAGRMDDDNCPRPCPPKPCPRPCPPPPCKPCPKPKQVPCEQPRKTECVPCVPCVREGITPFVLTTSRPCNDVGIYFFVDALYWYTDIGNTDYAYVDTNPSPTISSGRNEQFRFKWNWGFKVGLGFDLDHDEWDTDFYYTWLTGRAHDSFTVPAAFGPAVSLNTNFGATNGSIASGSAKARLNFNVLDWELGRWFYISDSISIRPFTGLKGSWIKLRETEEFTRGGTFSVPTFTSYSAKNRTTSWAVGPSAGIKSNWYFGSGNTIDPCDGHVRSRPHFSIFGDFSGALMYSHFKNKHSEGTTGPATATVYGFTPSHLNRNLLVPVLTGFMGLQYETCFNCDKFHFGLRLGYELQYWFRQNQRFAFDQDTIVPRYTRSTGEDLALQGMTLDLRFDF